MPWLFSRSLVILTPFGDFCPSIADDYIGPQLHTLSVVVFRNVQLPLVVFHLHCIIILKSRRFLKHLKMGIFNIMNIFEELFKWIWLIPFAVVDTTNNHAWLIFASTNLLEPLVQKWDMDQAGSGFITKYPLQYL